MVMNISVIPPDIAATTTTTYTDSTSELYT
jgi:hypothetical protein